MSKRKVRVPSVPSEVEFDVTDESVVSSLLATHTLEKSVRGEVRPDTSPALRPEFVTSLGKLRVR